MSRAPSARWACLAALLLGALPALAAQVLVPAGATLGIPSGMLVLFCSDLTVQGTLNAGSSQVGTAGNVTIAAGATLDAGASTLTVGGNWANSGEFAAGTSTVAFVDGCATSPAQLTGATAFANLTFASALGRSFVLPAGEAVSVAGQLTLSGMASAPIELVSANPSQPAWIVLGVDGSVSQSHVLFGTNVGLDGTALPRLANISTRGRVLTGDDVMIGGFIIGGSSPKTVVVRARGPSMAAQGVPGTLANPFLQLFSGATQIAVNDNWQAAGNAAAIQAANFHPADANEAAIMTTLDPGAYTAIVTGVAGGTGVAIVEVFEVDAATVPLINIATRGRVQTGDNVMIAGLIIQGDGPQTVVVRARGPSLSAAGVPNVLANPLLQLFSGPTQIAVNDDFGTAANAADLNASGFAPSNALESAILTTLAPGAYTAIVSGVGGTTGVAIVEVFKVGP